MANAKSRKITSRADRAARAGAQVLSHSGVIALLRPKPAVSDAMAVLNNIPSRPSVPHDQRQRLLPFAPVLTVELFDGFSKRPCDGQSQCFTLYPDVAEAILSHNVHNRVLHKSKVDEYASDMIEHAWNPDGHPIQIDVNGDLINGQHRLHAVIKSGEPVPMYFLFGLPTDYYKTMDNGVSRKAHDLFQHNGWRLPKIVAYMTTWIERYQSADFRGRATPRPRHQFDYAIRLGRAELEKIATTALAIHKLVGDIPAQYIGAAHYLARQQSPAEADAFFGAWAKGGTNELPVQRRVVNEIRTLHNKSHKAVLDTIQFAMVIKAWNCHANPGQVSKTKLHWSPPIVKKGVLIQAGDADPIVDAYVLKRRKRTA